MSHVVDGTAREGRAFVQLRTQDWWSRADLPNERETEAASAPFIEGDAHGFLHCDED
ncbi:MULTISPECIES: hypothetical protein [unclassified Myxococcus]|uniref:hypothetical protein n=2 Tax=Myxococcus TaxID=32 RepID=UPI00157B68BF|nr:MULTISPECIES: hypothetical protein [unclassified Myxococcus]NTX07697.1 hypothetical protein [Myxococcus sp. CA040A]NTX12832.1 hypothetical protein [Myxococcus sp. CA056]NTX39363.1 hypothetical protein [Myxococcus sp. CA033]